MAGGCPDPATRWSAPAASTKEGWDSKAQGSLPRIQVTIIWGDHHTSQTAKTSPWHQSPTAGLFFVKFLVPRGWDPYSILFGNSHCFSKKKTYVIKDPNWATIDFAPRKFPATSSTMWVWCAVTPSCCARSRPRWWDEIWWIRGI